ncbi:MAG: LysR substrate-binding domain-containing protein [Gammaproteobacteria bacterium]|nr:LysR substrate-binding domain-containing protein [Gammaproteobacteria bacterium]
MRRSSFRQFEVFEAIARNGSFTRAAEELFLTQPTVSMQVKKLVDTIGLPLFDKIGKRIYLTEAGEALLVTCHEIFNSLSNFEMQISDLKGLRQGKLSLAVVSTAKYFAPKLLGAFCKIYPGINVSLVVNNRGGLLERISENKDDLYILGQPPEDLNVEYEAFLDNHLVVLAPSDHPLAGQKNIPIARLEEEPFIMRECGSGTRIAVERLFKEHDLKLDTRIELGSSEAVKQTIMGGLGISVLSQHTVAQKAAMDQLAILDVKHFPIKRKWYVVYPSAKQLTIIARTFLEYLRNA